MKKTILIFASIAFFINSLSAQESEVKKIRPIQFYIGIQPTIDSEAYDEFRSTIDVNLIPLIVEFAVDQHWSIRLNPVIMLQFRPEFPTAISRVGGGITVPYHFSKKNSEEGHRGFYAGPSAAFTKHKIDGFNTTTISGEVGYAFIFNRVLSITVGVQGGTTIMFLPDQGYNRLIGHSAAIFSFGYWF